MHSSLFDYNFKIILPINLEMIFFIWLRAYLLIKYHSNAWISRHSSARPSLYFVDLLWWFESHEILHFHDKIVTTNDIENHYKSCCFSSINTWSIRLFHAKSDHIGSSSSWQALRHSALPFFFTLAIAEFWDCHFILFFDAEICYKVSKSNFILYKIFFI